MPDDARITRDRRAEGVVEEVRREGEEAALAIMCLLGPLVSDAAIVGRSYGWAEVITIVKAAADVLSAAQRLIDHWHCEAAISSGRAERDSLNQCATELAALLSDPIPPTEEDAGSQRYSRTSGIAEPEASPLSPANAPTDEEER